MANANRAFVSPYVGANGANGATRAPPYARRSVKVAGRGRETARDDAARRCFSALYARRKAGGGGKQRSAKTFVDGVVIARGARERAELCDMRGKRVASCGELCSRQLCSRPDIREEGVRTAATFRTA